MAALLPHSHRGASPPEGLNLILGLRRQSKQVFTIVGPLAEFFSHALGFAAVLRPLNASFYSALLSDVCAQYGLNYSGIVDPQCIGEALMPANGDYFDPLADQQTHPASKPHASSAIALSYRSAIFVRILDSYGSRPTVRYMDTLEGGEGALYSSLGPRAAEARRRYLQARCVLPHDGM